MRYTKDHKQKTREKIITAASRLFRRHGYNGVGIDQIMAEASLTRGGFYGHFSSKAALYRAVLNAGHEFVERLAERDETSLNDEAIRIAGEYVSPGNRKRIVSACTVAALLNDTVRADRHAKKAYAGAIRDLVVQFQRGLETEEALDERAISAVIASVGGLLLANAVDADRALSSAISDAAARQIAAALSD